MLLSCGVSSRLQYVPLDESSSSAPFKTLDFINDPSGIKIAQSCNGLICCRSNPRPIDDLYSTYYVCNPSTRQYCPIVCESKKHENGFEQLFSVSLAYDPLKSPHYKVVCLWLVSRPMIFAANCQIEIYSSETASWKLSGEVFSRMYRSYMRNDVFWNVYDEMLYMEPKHFGECKGRLYLTLSPVHSPANFEILEMKTDYTGWSKRYVVNLQQVEVEEESPKNMDMSFKEIQNSRRDFQDNVAYQYFPLLARVVVDLENSEEN
ncbi:hypothetical protein C5167_004582 [Papaver somniferum]|uniref:F-box associated beta-propeller type 3 domain-containing protein n=1 Tax=Papaver somniferum TaxID=3469 RepID=A0A4Y7JB98_PAPSO|nr:hypothetical protein C5167_004582 [Papaver somniferum]